MRVRNKLQFSVTFPFAGVGRNGKVLKAGELSPKLPTNRFYDPKLQDALSRGLITVEFDEEDVLFAGVAGIAGPFAQALSALQKLSTEDSAIVKKPTKKKVVVDKPVENLVRRKPVAKKVKVSADRPGLRDIRAMDLARELKVPCHVIAAALEPRLGKRVYPVTGVPPEHADAMRERYGSKLEIPEVSETARTSVSEARTLADLADEADGLISLSDLAAENRKGGFI